jgi:GTPase
MKQIGTKAREQIESMGGHQVYLELRVKVEKDWRNNESVLRRLGYKLKKDRKS